jgi:hypothetical protein
MRERAATGETQAETVEAIADMQGRIRSFEADLASMTPSRRRSGVAPRRAPRSPAGDPLAELAAKVEAAARPAGALAHAAGGPGSVPRRPPRRARASRDDALIAARRAIEAADDEVRGVLASAREQLAEIAARVRESLERLPDPVAAAVPPPGAAAATGWDEDHVYVGTVSVACGPFDDVEQLAAFQQALESLDGVGEVYTRSFDGNTVHFDVSLARPTVLLAQLKRVAESPLTVVEGGDRHVRLELVPER